MSESNSIDFSPARVAGGTAQAVTPTDITQPTALRDSRYTEITPDLPSQSIFYEFDSLSIRRFSLSDMTKLSAGTLEQSFRKIAEAIGATIDQDVRYLTHGDFTYFMYWHRLNSYPNSPLVQNWTCDNPEHHMQVNIGAIDEDTQKVITKETLQNTFVLKNQTQIEKFSFNNEELIDIAKDIESRFQVAPAPVLVRDIIEEDEAAQLPAEEMFLNRYAKHLNAAHGKTLADRRKFLRDKDSTELIELLERFIVTVDHGIEETTKCKCAYCGHESEVRVVLTPFSFLSFVPRK